MKLNLYNPKIILAGRNLNNLMPLKVFKDIISLAEKRKMNSKLKVLILGLTFKENCPDIRNTKIIDVINIFNQFNCSVDVYDPVANKNEVKKELDVNLISAKELEQTYDAILKLVSHNQFKNFKYKNY